MSDSRVTKLVQRRRIVSQGIAYLALLSTELVLLMIGAVAKRERAVLQPGCNHA